MTQAQKTIAKPAMQKAGASKAPSKPASKAASKPASKAATTAATTAVAKQAQKPAGANIAAMIVSGIAARIEAGSKFYARAMQYHKQAGTVFPRARNNETRAALKAEDVAQVFDMHDKKILAAGNAKGQAMFDVYMMAQK